MFGEIKLPCIVTSINSFNKIYENIESLQLNATETETILIFFSRGSINDRQKECQVFHTKKNAILEKNHLKRRPHKLAICASSTKRSFTIITSL